MKKIVYLWLLLVITMGGIKNIKAQNSYLYGTTSCKDVNYPLWLQSSDYNIGGGTGNIGSIFHIDLEDNGYYTDYNFLTPTPGMHPQFSNLVETPNGKLFGMTRIGGAFNKGVIFEYDPNVVGANYRIRFNFNGNNGANPYGSLLYSPADQMLYGMTCYGGANGKGVLFKFDPMSDQNALTIIYNFDGTHGSNPTGNLIIANNGSFFGMTSAGGANNKGVIFEHILNQTTIIVRNNFSLDAHPQGSLLQASNGKLYGMSYDGGSENKGTIFEFTIGIPDEGKSISNTLSFNWTNGALPYGSLIEDPDTSKHKLLGMTSCGGIKSVGTLFEYNFKNHSITSSVPFTGTYSGDNGQFPHGDLCYSRGRYYGVTTGYLSSDCGAYNGNIFEYSNGAINVLLNFTDGKHPHGSLMKSSNGNFYGMARRGGSTSDAGVLFEFNPRNTPNYNVKLRFQNGPNGAFPNNLVQAPNGKFYGTTKYGGSSSGGIGVIFEFDPISLNFTKKYEINIADQSCPDEIIIDKNLASLTYGHIFGISSKGLFEYDPSIGTNGTLYSRWVAGPLGGPPTGITMASDNLIYMMCDRKDLSSFQGSIVRYNPSSHVCQTVYTFNGVDDKHPVGRLVQQPGTSILYGMNKPDVNNYVAHGYIFAFDYNLLTFNPIYFFNGSAGQPTGSLNIIYDNLNGTYKLYGMTGNYNNWGGVFEFDLEDNSFHPKVYFGSNPGYTGGHPEDGLTQASNGLFYGSTTQGGAYGFGTLFLYNPITNYFATVQDLPAQYKISDLLINFSLNKDDNLKLMTTGITDNNSENIIIYPNPASDYVMISNAENANVQVFDVLGNKVMELNIISNNQQIEVSSLSKGTYIMKIIQNNQIITKRISLVK